MLPYCSKVGGLNKQKRWTVPIFGAPPPAEALEVPNDCFSLILDSKAICFPGLGLLGQYSIFAKKPANMLGFVKIPVELRAHASGHVLGGSNEPLISNVLLRHVDWLGSLIPPPC